MKYSKRRLGLALSTLPSAHCPQHLALCTLPPAHCPLHLAPSTLPLASRPQHLVLNNLSSAPCPQHLALSTLPEKHSHELRHCEVDLLIPFFKAFKLPASRQLYVYTCCVGRPGASKSGIDRGSNPGPSA